uniref:sn-1-specific diacylglycerol lipase n=1 Tax=Chlamydomonas euryale TaxID=1486919 RepID=A0A7R9YT88_9CHLO|mmetsp:Transcript_19555/g.58003  ORF Transcript_19555/g.58003 Transcript_19555/m.58003 type:complete len:312 (+) Transcript_19555:171-1106(+)
MASSGPPDIGSAQAGTAAGENAQPLDAQPLDAQLVAMADHSSGIRGNVLNTKTRLWSEVANRFNQQGIDAAVMIPKFLLLMVAFTFVMMITGTLDAVLEELEYDSLDSFLLAWLLLYFKSILLKNQQSNIPELGYLTGPNEQDSETLQGLDQDWVWSKKTYTFFEELGGGDPELDENKERLRTIMELEPGSIIKISSADNQYTIPYWVATHHKSKRILCVIRGTSSFTDKLIDAQAQTIVIKRTVGAHCAMYHVAESIVGQVTDDILGFAKDNSDYTLHFCGHSLGAGVCGLASYLVHESIGSGAKVGRLW